MKLIFQVLEMQAHSDAKIVYHGYEQNVAEAIYQEALAQGREVYISAHDENN